VRSSRVLPSRVLSIAVVLLLASVFIATAAGCEKDEESPKTTATPVSTPAAGPGSQAAAPSTDPTTDTAGTVNVTWTAIDGDARQDPMGC
jgi:FlaG/FlaF family flagellin (archaellin)